RNIAARLAESVKAHAEDNARNQQTIAELRQRLETQARPLEDHIRDLTVKLNTAQVEVADRDRLIKDSQERLALALEIPPVRGIGLPGLVSETVLMINEAKKMVQENL